MKAVMALCMAAALPLLAAEGGAMNDAERAYLISQLEASKKDFLSSLEGVTAAQWKFKPAPNVWSVAECAEHIVLSEDFLFNTSQQILKTPEVPRPASSASETDQKLVALVGDRSHKATAPEPIVPSGKFNSPADAAKAFTEKRNRNLEYARTSNDDLRVHVTKGPVGPMDAYQFLLLMASHTGRHTAQLREVQANPDYPKTAAKLQQFLVVYSLVQGTADQLTKEQMSKLNQHGAYLQSQAGQGRISWGGRVTDPKRPQGLVLLEVAGENEVREYLSNDPAVKAGVLEATIQPFQEVIRAPKNM